MIVSDEAREAFGKAKENEIHREIATRMRDYVASERMRMLHAPIPLTEFTERRFTFAPTENYPIIPNDNRSLMDKNKL